jgi:hypothetical protein
MAPRVRARADWRERVRVMLHFHSRQEAWRDDKQYATPDRSLEMNFEAAPTTSNVIVLYELAVLPPRPAPSFHHAQRAHHHASGVK